MARGPARHQGRRRKARPAPPPAPSARGSRREALQGRVQHHGRFAFLLSERPGVPDLMLRGPTLRLAMDGDVVEARVTEGGDRPSGEILRVVSRARKTAVGVLERTGGRWLARAEEDPEGPPIEVLGFDAGLTPAIGLAAVLRLSRWPTMQAGAGGVVQELLGRPGDPRVRVSAVLRTRELPSEFPREALAEAERLAPRVDPSAWEGRRRFFDRPVFTIDGADAKDFDDALSLESLGGGRWRLGVHIADVSHYVQPGSALDREAQARATSVYLPDRVVPMLPHKLSDDLCSLRPEVERLTQSCLIDLDEAGRVHAASFCESAIRSWKRFTYEEAEEVLEGRRPRGLDPRVEKTLREMGPLARALTRARMKRGALDFILPEHRVVVDAHGAPVRVEKRPRLASHRLVEEFMLAANEATARALKGAGAPLLHRIHEDPDPKRLLDLAAELKKLGVAAPGDLERAPARGLQRILERSQGHPLEETIHFLTVRSMRQAVYSEKGAIHFGLASQAYTHFTSPIRRYPDLFNHRAIRAMLGRKAVQGFPWAYAKGLQLGRLATHCSERERVAADAERQAVDILRAELLKGRVGQTLDALVTKLTGAGMLVALPEDGSVGLVRGATGRIGELVRVKLERVHEGRGELDFSLASRPPRR